jgi:hypothetical protein
MWVRRWSTSRLAQAGATGVLTCLLAMSAIASDAWDALVPAAEQQAPDPFEALTSEQLRALRVIVLARALAAAGRELPDEGRSALAQAHASLRSDGLHADGLLAQRDTLMAQRQRSAATVPFVDGHAAQWLGYVIPIRGSGQSDTEFMLVRSPSACSHATPAAANQVIHVSSALPVPVDGPGTQVLVEGVLRLQPREMTLQFIDGPVVMRSGYAISAARVTTTADHPLQSGVQLSKEVP